MEFLPMGVLQLGGAIVSDGNREVGLCEKEMVSDDGDDYECIEDRDLASCWDDYAEWL